MSEHRFTMPIATHLFLLQENRILLSRRFNTGYEDGNFSVIAGHLDGDEEIKMAMIREAEEEANIRISPGDIDVIGVMHRKSEDERIDFFLSATSWTGQLLNMEPHKCDLLEWFDLDDLPENVIPYVRKALENYRLGRWFNSFGWD